jgi:integrase/recombinase XerC
LTHFIRNAMILPYFPMDVIDMATRVKNDKITTKLKLAERLRHILLELPEFCYDFILSIETNTSILTRLNYAGDLRTFFNYLSGELQLFAHPVQELSSDDIKIIQPRHIEMFMDYLSIYEHNDRILQNKNLGKKRKLSAIRTFFKYMLKHGYISSLPTAIIDTPKIHEKPIIRLDGGEVLELLNSVENGKELTMRQASYQKITGTRDVALLKLMLGTGVRISECIGLNIDDVDFIHKSFRITRKGGKEAILYFSDDIKLALEDYMEQRKTAKPLSGHELALFLSMQNRRITARAVENLVEKYTKNAVPLKKITPHKLRSTFGTALYRATGDIYLVADVLGHRDVNTTRKHYADMSEENRKRAADAVQYEKNTD